MRALIKVLGDRHGGRGPRMWPEFGYGMKPVAQGYCDLVPWRGDRDERSWPKSLRHDKDGIRWVEHDGRGHEPERAAWSPTSALGRTA